MRRTIKFCSIAINTSSGKSHKFAGGVCMTGMTLDSLDYKQRYVALMYGTDLAIFILHCDGNIRTWNQAGQELKQYTEDEVIGKHISMFYEEEEKSSGIVEKELRVAEAKGRYEGGGWRLRKDGSRF